MTENIDINLNFGNIDIKKNIKSGTTLATKSFTIRLICTNVPNGTNIDDLQLNLFRDIHADIDHRESKIAPGIDYLISIKDLTTNKTVSYNNNDILDTQKAFALNPKNLDRQFMVTISVVTTLNNVRIGKVPIYVNGYAIKVLADLPKHGDLKGKATFRPGNTTVREPSRGLSCETTIESGTATNQVTLPDVQISQITSNPRAHAKRFITRVRCNEFVKAAPFKIIFISLYNQTGQRIETTSAWVYPDPARTTTQNIGFEILNNKGKHVDLGIDQAVNFTAGNTAMIPWTVNYVILDKNAKTTSGTITGHVRMTVTFN